MNGTDHSISWTTHRARRRGLTVAKSTDNIQTFRRELKALGFEIESQIFKKDNRQSVGFQYCEPI